MNLESTNNVVMNGILLAKNQGLPWQYSKKDVRKLQDALMVWVAPSHIERFDDPQENRRRKDYTIWQRSTSQRRRW